jgi:CubicO group peptidase (beta-lactamase class C family)
MRLPFLALPVAAMSVVVALGRTTVQEQTLTVPTPAVEAVSPDSLTFDGAVTRAASLPRIRSLVISVDGRLAAERYYHGATAARPTNIKSASKSIISTLVGAAIDRGLIASVREPIGKYFPEYLTRHPEKGAITIEDLITMRSGLETTSNRNYGRWVQSSNWVRHVLERPVVDAPGGRMIYSTGSTHLLSAILTKATKTSTLAFARSALGQPLGVSFDAWTRDPQGIYLGGNEMAMRPRDMLRIGELYLNEGRTTARGSFRPNGSGRRSRLERCRVGATVNTATAGGFARSPAVPCSTRGGTADSSSSSCRPCGRWWR